MAATDLALPEHWTELNASRKNREACAADIRALKAKYLRDAAAAAKQDAESQSSAGGGVDGGSSPAYFGEVLDRMLGRYRDSQDREWFSERRAVVFSLETMFAEAKERKMGLDEIEASLECEKEAWYRWVLRRHPEFLAVAGSGVGRDEVRSILDDPDRSREELVAVVGQAVGMSTGWLERVDTFAAKVAEASGDPIAVRELYAREFFHREEEDGAVVVIDNAQPYLDMFESGSVGGVDITIEAVVDRIIAANREDRSSQAQRDAHQKRLDELRRARTAFEQNRVRSRGPQQKEDVVDHAYRSLPNCDVCDKPVDPERVVACPLCQMVLHIGGSRKLTVYCSDGCLGKGFDTHMAQTHDCIGSSDCAQMVVDEDVVMRDDGDDQQDDSADPVACNECLDQKRMAVFCSRRCAERNFTSHRHSQHGEIDTPVSEIQTLVSPLGRLASIILTQDKTGLQFS
ncbi:hypothetical protein GMORB2_5217 [Geosmithia morbida]|uniref:Uncharacterized protein n=1 Tax=Geosmithia morbida TaxID=1094350 RepID=A0A9P4YWV8_9HYPO|nr:uncharacterized protein GMORB2_5217 [Geosmithia morbida]KAF4124551.1 hypothetical protein GMORB2_5217 [Geosmithia morbida]